MAKHFLVYYKRGTGSLVVTEPRPWARENQDKFPDFDFVNAQVGHHPTTDDVEAYLTANYHFQQYAALDGTFTVLFNFDPDIDL